MALVIFKTVQLTWPAELGIEALSPDDDGHAFLRAKWKTLLLTGALRFCQCPVVCQCSNQRGLFANTAVTPLQNHTPMEQVVWHRKPTRYQCVFPASGQNLSDDKRLDFSVGHSFFAKPWVEAHLQHPKAVDGLFFEPLFNTKLPRLPLKDWAAGHPPSRDYNPRSLFSAAWPLPHDPY